MMVKFNSVGWYGIEIEFSRSRRDGTQIHDHEILDAVNARGIRVRRNPDSAGGWILKTDVSAGWQLVSPPMQGLDGREQLKKACEGLQEVGAYITRDCGLHVHHNAQNLTEKQIQHAVYLYSAFQPPISEALSPSRQNNRFCPQTTYNGRMMEHVQQVGVDNIRNHSRYGCCGYNALNVGALSAHGTLEFRQHKGSTNFERIWAWVVFTQTFVTVASMRSKLAKPSRNAKGEWRGMRNALGLRKRADSCEITFWAMSEMGKQRLKFGRGRGRTE